VHASLDHGQTFERDGMMIRADSVRRLGPDPERGIYERLSLTGVAAIERDEHGAIIGEATASHALVAFAQVDGPAIAPEPGGRTPRGGPWSGEESPSAPLVTRISMVLRNAHRTGDRWGRAVAESLPIQITVPEFLHDKPKYLSNRE